MCPTRIDIVTRMRKGLSAYMQRRQDSSLAAINSNCGGNGWQELWGFRADEMMPGRRWRRDEIEKIGTVDCNMRAPSRGRIRSGKVGRYGPPFEEVLRMHNRI